MRRPRAATGAAVVATLLVVATTTSAVAQAPEAAFATVELLPVPTQATLLGIAFADAQHGWAVGDRGTILATTDGGATWHQQASGVPPGIEECSEAGCFTSLLRDVEFVDPRNGWAVGSEGLILHTADGGATWLRQSLPPIESIEGDGPGNAGEGEFGRGSRWGTLYGVAFTDTQSGAVVGPGGTILATTDGGQTWRWRGDRRFGALSELSFADRDHGQAVGNMVSGHVPYVTVATEDGGSTWRLVDPPDLGPQLSSKNFTAVYFTEPRHGWVGGEGGRILRTTDGGRRWAVQRKDTTETFEGLAFADDRRGLAVGYTDFTAGRRGSLIATADGGETWVSRLVQAAILWDATFATPETAYVVGCETATNTCQKSLIARVTFPARTAGDAGGGSGLPWPLIGGAAAVVLAGIVLVARRRNPPYTH